jgi:hypothetical protein
MPSLNIPAFVLDRITQDFPVCIMGLDAEGLAEVFQGEPYPHPELNRIFISRELSAKKKIRDEFFDHQWSVDRYLRSVTIFPDIEEALFEYIYVRKSPSWAHNLLIAEVTLQQFEMRPLDPLERRRDPPPFPWMAPSLSRTTWFPGDLVEEVDFKVRRRHRLLYPPTPPRPRLAAPDPTPRPLEEENNP